MLRVLKVLKVLKVRVLGVLGVLMVLLSACSKPPLPYPDQIAAWHAEKDRFMRDSSESPLPAEKRATFSGLAYFAVDPDYRIPAMLQVAPNSPPVEMPTSTGCSSLRRHPRGRYERRLSEGVGACSSSVGRVTP